MNHSRQPDAESEQTRATVIRFQVAFNQHDVDQIMQLMSGDCVFENTYPPPDGERFEGADDVRKCWEHLFASSPNAVFETEELLAIGDRAVLRWRYTWHDNATSDGHVRGVDVFRVQDGKVAEKLSYVKG